MLSPEDLVDARAQLQEQVEKMADGPQKENARRQLASMTDESISAMVEGQRTSGQKDEQRRSIFRMIVDGTVPSKKIDENKEAIAVVSIRPVSRGHVIIIPKRLSVDSKELPAKALTMAKRIAKKMISKLKAMSTEIQTSKAFDETIINVIPIYDARVNVNSPPYEAEEKELEEIHRLLKVVRQKKTKVIKKETRKEDAHVLKLKRRVP